MHTTQYFILFKIMYWQQLIINLDVILKVARIINIFIKIQIHQSLVSITLLFFN